MICNKCGKALPNEGAVCKFCGAMMDQNQIEMQKKMQDPNQNFQAKLLSDRYGVDKKIFYKNEKEEQPKENKMMGAIVIIIVLLIIIFLAILINIGR